MCARGLAVGQADNDGAQHIGVDLKERVEHEGALSI